MSKTIFMFCVTSTVSEKLVFNQMIILNTVHDCKLRAKMRSFIKEIDYTNSLSHDSSWDVNNYK